MDFSFLSFRTKNSHSLVLWIFGCFREDFIFFLLIFFCGFVLKFESCNFRTDRLFEHFEFSLFRAKQKTEKMMLCSPFFFGRCFFVSCFLTICIIVFANLFTKKKHPRNGQYPVKTLHSPCLTYLQLNINTREEGPNALSHFWITCTLRN